METRHVELRPSLRRQDINRLKGQRPSQEHFDSIIDSSSDGYDTEDGRLVFRFRKLALSAVSVDLAKSIFADIDQRLSPSFRRKSAAGRIDLARIREHRQDVVSVEPFGRSGFTGHFVLTSGRRLTDPMSNPVLSYTAGYNYDRYRGIAVPTGFSARFPIDWVSAAPFFESIGDSFNVIMPDVSRHMHNWCLENNIAQRFTISRTCLSTVAINVNYQSCFHHDVGDLPSGYSTLTAMAIGGDFRGGLLVLPKYRIAINIRDGDLLCNQSHVDLHGNTEVVSLSPGAKRLSFVTYLKKMLRYATN